MHHHEPDATVPHALRSVGRRDPGAAVALADGLLPIIYDVTLAHLKDRALAAEAAEAAALAVWRNRAVASRARGGTARQYVVLVALQHAEGVRTRAETAGAEVLGELQPDASPSG